MGKSKEMFMEQRSKSLYNITLEQQILMNEIELMDGELSEKNEVELEINKKKLTKELLDSTKWDYVVDCIDTLSPKVFFIKACLDRKIPIVSSLGAGGKIDPSQVIITDK